MMTGVVPSLDVEVFGSGIVESGVFPALSDIKILCGTL